MGKLVVSFSEIKDWKNCRQLHYYKHVLGLRPRHKSTALRMGSIIHTLIETYLKGQNWRAKVKELIADLGDQNLFEEERLVDEESILRSEKIMSAYVRHWKKIEPVKTLGVEVSFGCDGDKLPAVEIFPEVFLKGRIDWVFEDYRGVWVAEHKTTGRKWPKNHIRLYDLQTSLYSMALPKLGFPKPIGISFDYIKSKPPTEPKVLKKGGLSRNKRINTDYHTYLKAIKDNNLDPMNYQQELHRAKQNIFFERMFLPRPVPVINSLMKEVVLITKEIKLLRDYPYRNLGRGCEQCSFFNLCTLELSGIDSEQFIKAEFTKKEGGDRDEGKEVEED